MAPPPPSPPSVTLRTVLLLFRVLTAAFLVITVVLISTNTVTLEISRTSIKLRFNDVYAFRYMLSAAVIGLLYALVQLFLQITQFATGTTHPLNYQFNFYGDKIISYLLATGSAAGFGVSKDLKDTYLAFIVFDSTDPVDEFFSKGYAAASLLLLAFVSLAVLSVFSSLALSKQPIQNS
ncbi:PREDICTED: CASP-like protein 4D1 [Camelina sativa]|uniref:CASP-like protein n=1 Tax=Camelina sativa TaxID=90675 RepID=A0ABM0Z182_CAMSA|nr:PREDICTED: CASP-like protein 4D1 [Camelina sativa]